MVRHRVSKPARMGRSRGFPAIRKSSGNKKRCRPVLCLRWVCNAGTGSVTERQRLDQFERAVLPHLNAAYNLARWLTRNDADAEDVVQEAYLRAFRFFGGFHGEDGRAWLLGIVRNTSYTWMQRNRSPELNMPLDDQPYEAEGNELNPEELLLQKADAQTLRKAVEELPVEFREVLVLRELNEMSYK